MGTDQSASEPIAVESSPTSSIARIWRGRTSGQNFETYSKYLKEAVYDHFGALTAVLSVQVLRRLVDGVGHFTVIVQWSSIEALQRYSGTDIYKPRHAARDRELLLELPDTVEICEVLDRFEPGRSDEQS